MYTLTRQLRSCAYHTVALVATVNQCAVEWTEACIGEQLCVRLLPQHIRIARPVIAPIKLPHCPRRQAEFLRHPNVYGPLRLGIDIALLCISMNASLAFAPSITLLCGNMLKSKRWNSSLRLELRNAQNLS